MPGKSSNQINVPEARQAMNNLKQEVASELGITLKQGYNGDIAAKDAGHISAVGERDDLSDLLPL